MTEKTAKRLERLLTRLLAVLEAPNAKPKVPGDAVVSSIVRRTTDEGWRVVAENDGQGGDVPSQLTRAEVEAQKWQESPRSSNPRRGDTKPVPGASGRI